MPHSCNDAPTARSDPLIAFCITGALRSFGEPRVHGSIKENLIDSFADRSKVFVVASFDCRIGTDQMLNRDAQTAKCVADYSTHEIDRALAYVGAETFEVVPNRAPAAVDCALAPHVERHPSFWYQQIKTMRCFEHVERYEREHDVCFDWVVRARPDDVWKAKVPPATVLPRGVVTTGGVWPYLAEMQHWRNNFTAMEDHFMAVPRAHAAAAFSAFHTWFDCRPAVEYDSLCPPQMLHFDHRKTPLMQSECLLGLHLRERGVRWRVDPRFSYIMRRVPLRFNFTEPYTRMLNTMEHQPGEWNESVGRVTSGTPEEERRRRAFYQQREHAVQTHKWGEDLRMPERLHPLPPTHRGEQTVHSQREVAG